MQNVAAFVDHHRMFRPTAIANRWVCAISMVFVLLAWPLHMAQHAAEGVAGMAAAATAAIADAGGGADIDADAEPGGGGGGNAPSHACAWCMFHGDHATAPGAPPALRFHAEASAPPRALPSGQPTGCCTLAAEPRGPPAA